MASLQDALRGQVAPELLTEVDDTVDSNAEDLGFAGAHAFTCIDFTGAATNTETIIIGSETYTLLTAGIVTTFDFTGGSANAQAISLAAVINADSQQAITAVVVGDSVFVFYDVIGTIGNLVITNTLTNVTVDNMHGGLDVERKQQFMVSTIVTASEVAAGQVHIPTPFVPRTWNWWLSTTNGVEKVDGTNAESYDGAITLGTSPNRLIFAAGTNLLMAATDVLHVVCWD
jgi:hypothetical protein